MARTRSVSNSSRAAFAASALLFTLALSGCAQQKEPGYYAQGRESTLSDAQNQAQRRGARAPSQVQLGFGDETKKPQPSQPDGAVSEAAETTATTRSSVRPLREPKTFLGTVPCLTGATCPASRVTLTVAPNGQWRARTQQLDAAGASDTSQGCWDVIGAQPWRIVLRSKENAAATSFTFTNDNVLRIDTFNGVRPTLEHHLTRQPDVDPIDELNSASAPQCDAPN